MNTLEFDYIIVGAGSAGCVLAERLSADGRHTVAVLEAGGSDRRLWIQLPIGYAKTYDDPAVNWCYETEPCAGLNHRRSFWPRGKVLGGSGSINAMVYVRGADRDFDDWAQAGNPGWSAADVAPAFERLETRLGEPQNDWPRLHVNDVGGQLHSLCDHFLAAAGDMQTSVSNDFNLDSFEGFGRYSINTRDGRRMSAARAFLRPALKRAGVHLMCGCDVTSVTFDGKRATGVDCISRGQPRHLRARAEVILCAGAIGSPLLLQRSGIGEGGLLQQMDIPLVKANANVGGNLQDHIAVSYLYRSNLPTLNDQLGSWSGRLRAGLQYLFTRRGPLSLSINQAGGFVRSAADLAAPDLQLYFTPASYSKREVAGRAKVDLEPWSGFLTSFQPCRPRSRGRLRISDPDWRSAPVIEPNYLSHPDDLDTVLAGCHYLRRLAQTASLRAIIDQQTAPAPACTSDEDILADFRQRADTVYHPVGSCAMNRDERLGVVDSELRVHGVERLRVIDASIFPNVTSGNTNAATMMVADKGARLILR